MAQEVGHVEKDFVFGNLREKKIPIELHIGTQRLAVHLVESGKRLITVEPVMPDAELPQEKQTVVAFFRFRGRPMTFRSTVAEVDDGRIHLRQIDVLHRDLNRGFERIVNPDGISVSLVVQGSSYTLNYPASEMYDPVEKPEYDYGFDITRISSLIGGFREQAERIGADNRIVMFRERRPETLPERIVAHTGRIVTLPPWEGDMQTLDVSVRERLALRRHVEAFAREQDSSIVEQYEQYLQQLRRKGISMELYCPILYHQYVVGYLYLMHDLQFGGGFTAADLESVRMFARILSYSLQSNGYFQTEQEEQAFQQAQLIDISGSGLLFSHGADALDLGLYSEIGLQIHLDERTLPAKGRIMRKYSDAQRTYYGVHYSSMELRHMEQLFDRIYGPDYRGDIDSRGLAIVEAPHDPFDTA